MGALGGGGVHVWEGSVLRPLGREDSHGTLCDECVKAWSGVRVWALKRIDREVSAWVAANMHKS